MQLHAQCIRIYTTLSPDFYAALNELNEARERAREPPLLLLHGIWVPEEHIRGNETGAFVFPAPCVCPRPAAA